LKPIQQADIDHWRTHGYVIVKEFMTKEELANIHRDLNAYLPSWDEYARRQPLYANLSGGSSRGAPGWVRHEFPYLGDALNKMAVHPFLEEFVKRLVGHDCIALSHGAIVGKYAGKGDYDQELHPDYTNNTLAFPADGTDRIDIPVIVYHTDVTIDLGPTYVVSSQLTSDLVSSGRRFHSRADFPQLYEAEVPAVMPAGSALIYNMRTFHRGSAMRAAQGVRFSQFVGFHTAGVPWLGSTKFQSLGDTPEMHRFLANATPHERELIGFPAQRDPYWTEETLAGVGARYPDMDMAPYRLG
jgi:ectoine hydroxylase-related dioxygenase (phytanoyl-CoA dioxygenase family)